jgi:hypothetical protein
MRDRSLIITLSDRKNHQLEQWETLGYILYSTKRYGALLKIRTKYRKGIRTQLRDDNKPHHQTEL